MDKSLMLTPLRDPVSTYSQLSPQRITLDTGSTFHHVVNSRRSTGAGSAFDFTIPLGDLPQRVVSRISPASVVAHLTIFNINKYNNKITVRVPPAVFGGNILVTLIPGCYNQQEFAIEIQRAINLGFLQYGVAYSCTATYSATTDTLLLALGVAQTFFISACTFLTEGRYLMNAAATIGVLANSHTFTGISMVYSPYIHISASTLTASSRYTSYGGGKQSFISLAWNEPWIKSKTFTAGSAFTSSHFILTGASLSSTSQILLFDDYGHTLEEYCPNITSDYFSMILAFMV